MKDKQQPQTQTTLETESGQLVQRVPKSQRLRSEREAQVGLGATHKKNFVLKLSLVIYDQYNPEKIASDITVVKVVNPRDAKSMVASFPDKFKVEVLHDPTPLYAGLKLSHVEMYKICTEFKEYLKTR